jgi:uncharacterized protein with von Willebrand factor type A (vWA) domain
MKTPPTPSNRLSTAGPPSTLRGVVEFCRFARGNGLGSGLKAVIDSVRAVGLVDHGRLDAFRYALRATLCTSKREWDLFDQLFDAFWYGGRMDRAKQPVAHPGGPTLNARNSQRIHLMLGRPASPESGAFKEKRKAITGASAIDRLSKVDFSEVPQGDLAELEHLSELLLRRMSFRLSRRQKISHMRDRIDLRRTIRAGAALGGEFIDLRYKNRRSQAARLVILLDVSDSMNPYSLFLFKFAYALGKCFDRVSCFVFSTRLVDVSNTLKANDLAHALRTLSAITTFWSGGTKIGSSLQEFNRRFGRQMRSTNTCVLILSDGWDTGEPDVLVAELKTLKQRSKKLIWLNPLLGLARYEPVTRGMRAALPYIDVFAPAHNLQSLLELGRHV